MKATAKRYALISFLTLVFIVDDVLIYLLLKNLFDWRIDPILLSLGGTLVVALNLAVALFAYRTMHRKPTTGQEGMIGKRGVVLKSKVKGMLQIRVQGEIWQAVSHVKVGAGDKVRIEDIEGLRLIVSKSDD